MKFFESGRIKRMNGKRLLNILLGDAASVGHKNIHVGGFKRSVFKGTTDRHALSRKIIRIARVIIKIRGGSVSCDLGIDRGPAFFRALKRFQHQDPGAFTQNDPVMFFVKRTVNFFGRFLAR